MFGISWAEFIVVLLVAILVVPARYWPDVARALARAVKFIRAIIWKITDATEKIKEQIELEKPLDDIVRQTTDDVLDTISIKKTKSKRARKKMKKMTMMQHFAELRRRILWTVGFFVVAFIGGWYLAPFIQEFLTAPLVTVWDDAQMLYTGITDGLMINLSLAFMVAIMLTIPVGLYQIWAFMAPGLHQNERRFVVPIFVLSPLLFLIGAAFAFYALFPTVFGFFMELNESAPIPAVIMPAVRDYVSFAIGLLKVFGIAFQLPLVLVILNRAGILSRARVIGARRYAIVGIVIVAAILTPPDVVSQLMLAVPMWALFEISILFMKK